jgi:cell division septation protein DedD
MAKRPKTQARRNGGSGFPGWAWLLIGLLLGAAGFAAYSLRGHWSSPTSLLPQPNPDARPPASSDDGTPVAEPVEKPRPKYDFYTLLPEKEVVIPDAELEARARAEAARRAAAANVPATTATTPASPATAPTEPATTGSGERYLIQAGAFRGSNEAEALKAQIALTGEVARIESAEINGVTVYRVRMGPYPDASALAAAKQALAAHGIDGAQAIRVK